MVSSHHRKRRRKSWERQEIRFLAHEAVTFLIEESLRIRLTDPLQSQEFFRAARKIGKRGRFHIPPQYHFLFCRSCYYPLSIKTAKIRLNSRKKQIHYLCLNCKKEQRFGYIWKRKRNKEE